MSIVVPFITPLVTTQTEPFGSYITRTCLCKSRSRSRPVPHLSEEAEADCCATAQDLQKKRFCEFTENCSYFYYYYMIIIGTSLLTVVMTFTTTINTTNTIRTLMVLLNTLILLFSFVLLMPRALTPDFEKREAQELRPPA